MGNQFAPSRSDGAGGGSVVSGSGGGGSGVSGGDGTDGTTTCCCTIRLCDDDGTKVCRFLKSSALRFGLLTDTGVQDHDSLMW